MIMQAIGAGVISAVSFLGACSAPTVPAPAMTPCEGINLTVYGFGSPVNCDLTPPQTLSVFVEHPAPWSPVEADTFFHQCDQAGGTVTDADGDAWQCSNVDY